MLKKFGQFIVQYVKDEKGMTVVEGLIYAGAVAAICYVAINNLGTPLKSGASGLGNSITAKMAPSWT
ncbi:MAG: Flp family type IVb pilin [Syntrophothermus sp.]|uniref:Flp family type IVb pilin n=1 Tax=Syntrophothermus sp. TaxID=2736299 RepID=UPI00257D09AB|nr:hypothetical protein [Syntrophothermus sp.]NSW82721.1 Flp family type IVb pilin [Syntrophothermus sp.]